MVSARLLVVEDQSIIALDLKNRLTGLGYSVVGTAAYAEAAIQEASALRPDLVLMDIRLKGDMDGIEAAERIRAELDLPVIFLTAHSDERTLQRARLSEPYGYILKPFEDREVHMAIEIALYKHQMEARLKAHERWLAATLTSIGDAVIATDQAGRIEFMNPAAEAATGWTHADAIGRDLGQVFRLVHDETRAPLLSPVAAGLQDGARFESTDHAVLVARDGSEVPIEDSAAPIRDERGALTGVVLVFHDVTERRRAERRLQASEKQFRQVVEHIHDALIREDAGGQITFANEQFLTLFGLARPQLAALRPADCVALEWRDQWQAWRDRQQRGEAATFEYEGLCRDGQRLWLEGDRTPLWDEAGRMIGAQTVIRDITARKQADAALQASERRFRALIENSSAGITVIDPAGLLRYASPSTSRILGFAPNERQGRPITELLHPDDAPEVLAQLEQLRQTPGGSVTRLFRARHRAGHWRWLEATATNLLDDPAVGGLVVNFDDITERKRADEQLRLLSRAVQQSPVSIIITDTAGRIEYVNPHFTEVTGYQRAEVLGLNPSLLNAGQTPSAEYQRLWTTLAAGGEWRGEFCNKKKSGELFWQLAWISAIRNDRDEITHFVAVQEDITERRQAAEALRVSNIELTRLLAQAKDLAAAAQQANRLKDEILANTSHELRTPLTAIMGALDIVLGGLYTSDDEMRAFVHAARDAADRLLHLVNDLLDLAKLEAGRLQPKREIVDLPALLADVQALMRGQAGPKGLALEVEWPDHPLPPCLGDAEHLRRILLNLLNNAVKFTAHGGITIAVRTAPGLPTRAGAGRQVQIAVQDTGIGIPLEMQPRLFQPFAQVDGSSTRRYGGTGLGLSISRQLAELMGGTLTLHSAGAGQGSTFTLSLPLLQS